MKLLSAIRRILSAGLVLALMLCVSAAALAEESYIEPQVQEAPVAEPEPQVQQETPSQTETPAETPSQTETPAETPSQTDEPSETPAETEEPAATPSIIDADESSSSADETAASVIISNPPGEDAYEEEDEESESTSLYSGNPTIIYDFEGVSGFDYTDIPALAHALDSIFEGHVSIYANAAHTEEVLAALGTFLVPNNDVLQYVGAYGDSSRSMIGTSCWIYGNGFYYTLFGDYVGNGTSYTAGYSENLYIEDVSYAGFQAAGVRQQPGAYLRLGGRHTISILNYDEYTVTIIDGNGDGIGGVAIREYSWSDFAQRVASFGGVSHTVQATESYFRALYPYTVAKGDCGASARWYLDENGLLTIIGEGEIDPAGYADYADQVTAVTVEDGVTVIPRAAFADFENLEAVTLPESMELVGYNAFDGTALDEEVLEHLYDNVETLGSPDENQSHDYVRLSIQDNGAPDYEELFVSDRYTAPGRAVSSNEDVLVEEEQFAEHLRNVEPLVPIELEAEALMTTGLTGNARIPAAPVPVEVISKTLLPSSAVFTQASARG